MPCLLFLDLISKSFPMLLPAQCSSILLVSFQILLQIQDSLENSHMWEKADLKTLAQSKNISLCFRHWEWAPLAKERAKLFLMQYVGMRSQHQAHENQCKEILFVA